MTRLFVVHEANGPLPQEQESISDGITRTARRLYESKAGLPRMSASTSRTATSVASIGADLRRACCIRARLGAGTGATLRSEMGPRR